MIRVVIDNESHYEKALYVFDHFFRKYGLAYSTDSNDESLVVVYSDDRGIIKRKGELG